MSTENDDLLANATAALSRFREEERQLENDLAAMGARLETIRQFIAALTGRVRPKRVRRAPVPLPEGGEPMADSTDGSEPFELEGTP
jgi:hypothetical protein